MTFFSNPKRKDYVLNPRGKALYDDSSRFGTKMLEKMGWSKGKGLGANLDGQLDFIKVSHKSNQSGVGFKDRDDQWTSHESNFNSLLNSFKSADNSDEESQDVEMQRSKDNEKVPTNVNNDKKAEIFSGVSLEEQSKNSRARVHYKKFTRGKDLSRYSEKDLANIFGKKSLNAVAEGTSGESNDEDKLEKSSQNTPNFGITTIETGTTINEYFKKKMKNSNANGLNEAPNAVCDVGNEENVHRKKKEKKNRNRSEANDSKSEFPQINDNNLEMNNETAAEVEKTARSETIKRKCDDDSIEEGFQSEKKKKKKKTIEQASEVIDEKPEQKVMEKEPSESKKRKKSSTVNDCDISDDNGNHQPPKKSKSKNKPVDISDNGPVEKLSSKKLKKSKKDESSDKTPIDQSSTNLFKYIADTEMNENHSEITTDNIYTIRRYRAEIFGFVDLHAFPGSTLSDIPGYGYTNGMTLNITEKGNESQLIHTLWNGTMDKYANSDKQKKKKFVQHIGDLKKKNIFKI